MPRLRATLMLGLLLGFAGDRPADANDPADAERMRPRRQLMSPQRERRLRRLLPEVDDATIAEMLRDPATLLYTEREMPRAYQFWSGSLQGIHLANYNISANDSEPYGNGNLEFPWGTPAGAHRAKRVRSLRLLRLPRDEAGKTLPVVWYRKRLRGDASVGYGWRFPVGTTVGEVLALRGPDGKDYTFELRLRTREYEEWSVDVYRPFPRAGDLAERIRELRPGWEGDEQLARLVTHLEEPIEMQAWRLADNHPRRVIDQRMGVDELPPAGDDELVKELLTTTTFRSALGAMWRKGTNGTWTCAPTTKAAFHVVPAGYAAGFIEADRVSCMRCHKTVNQNVARFQAGRDWYGRIRGSDGIFSFHPFDPGAISGNGGSLRAKMRTELVRWGMLQRLNAKKHPDAVYHRIPYLDQ